MQFQKNIWIDRELIKVLEKNGIAVMPTDTIYGIVGRADSASVVNRIYEIRKRDANKPFIILIRDILELEKFSINLSEEQKLVLKEYWSFDPNQNLQPEPVSVVLDCPDDSFAYLHRGTQTLAFRVPYPPELRNLLKETGPLVAPSANMEKFPSSENVRDAKTYFGDMVDLYVDGGPIVNKASKVIKLHKDGSASILRE